MDCLYLLTVNVTIFLVVLIEPVAWAIVSSSVFRPISVTYGTTSVQHRLRSSIQCAAACDRDDGCKAYSYNKATGICKMGTDIDGPGIYGKVGTMFCPTGKGYELIYAATMGQYLCLRYKEARVPNAVAKAACDDDDAHLVLIESEDMRTDIDILLDSKGQSGFCHFDGFDDGHNGQFITSKGKPLPWENWASNQPEGNVGEDCIVGKDIDNYLLRDFHCTQDGDSYLWQIDM